MARFDNRLPDFCQPRIENWFKAEDGEYHITIVHGQVSAGSRRATPREVLCIEEQKRYPILSIYDGVKLDDEG